MTAKVFRKPGSNSRVTLKAPAKVNLHLEVIRQRHDGYHEIETVLQTIGLHDTVTVSLLEKLPAGKPQIELVARPFGEAPENKTNLCWRAVDEYCRRTRHNGRFLIELDKKIPTAAGLGGGSSDAAATLVACDALFGDGHEEAELEKMGERIGSDVPFFIRGGTALGRGRGTDLSPLPSVQTGQFLIIKPNIKLLSSNVYGNLKMGLTVRSLKANIQGLKPLLARFPTEAWIGFNRLEEVVLPSNPILQRLILHLREIAPVAMLSGSGAAVVAVFQEDVEVPELPDEFSGEDMFTCLTGPCAAGAHIVDE